MIIHSLIFLPSAKVVAERLCFHRCLSVHGGEVYTPWADKHPPGRDTSPDTPGQKLPMGRHPQLGRHAPLGRRPPRQTPPRQTPPGLISHLGGRPTSLDRHPTPPTDGHCSGRCASYWNAFLIIVTILTKQKYVEPDSVPLSRN